MFVTAKVARSPSAANIVRKESTTDSCPRSNCFDRALEDDAEFTRRLIASLRRYLRKLRLDFLDRRCREVVDRDRRGLRNKMTTGNVGLGDIELYAESDRSKPLPLASATISETRRNH
jgi:hypothetical protein